MTKELEEGVPEIVVLGMVAKGLRKFKEHMIQRHHTHPDAVPYIRKDLSDARIAEHRIVIDGLNARLVMMEEAENLQIASCITLVATARNDALEEVAEVADFVMNQDLSIAGLTGEDIRALKTDTTT